MPTEIEVIGILLGFGGLIVGTTAIGLTFEIRKEERETRNLIQGNRQRDIDYFLSDLCRYISNFSSNFFDVYNLILRYNASQEKSKGVLGAIEANKIIMNSDFNTIMDCYESKKHLIPRKLISQFIELKKTKTRADDRTKDKPKQAFIENSFWDYVPISFTLCDLLLFIQDHSKFTTDDLKEQVSIHVNHSIEDLKKIEYV